MKFDKSKLPSRHVSVGVKSAAHRSMYYAMGLKKEDIENCSHLILPGVGAYKTTINYLTKKKLINTIKNVAKKKPVLGICLGMQLLFDYSTEHGKTKGLGLIKGSVKKFDFKENQIKIPNIGWNKIDFQKQNLLFKNLNGLVEVYFVHSYHMDCHDKTNIIATTKYGHQITAAVNKDNIYGTQFHPEKSQDLGLQILENFIFSWLNKINGDNITKIRGFNIL